MRTNATNTRSRATRAVLDVLLILAISVAAESAHFAVKQGRHVICGDSVQYVDNARALLSDERDPHFAMRNPGYSFLLAGVALALGNMGWAAVATNHGLLALLPLAAYALGRCLASRWIGWLAAMLTLCRLQTFIRGERIMSECLYTFLLSFGVAAFAWALSRPGVGTPPRSEGRGGGRMKPVRPWQSVSPPPRATRRDGAPPPGVRRWLLLAGTLFALSWLTRSIGVSMIAAAMVMILYTLRSAPRRALIHVGVFLLPVVAALLWVCALNHRYEGRFRPTTGCLGPGITLRCRFMQGVPFPPTEAARRCLELLPERSAEEAYLSCKLDAWVARYRAIHDQGMTEWEYDALMRRAGLELIVDDPAAYARLTALLAGAHLLRRPLDPATSPVPDSLRRPMLLHPSAPDEPNSREHWYAYWALPHQPLAHSLELVEHMKAEAVTKAPFGSREPWATLRYVAMLPATVQIVAVVNRVASLWPGFAILLCGPLGLNRRVCAFIGLAYLCDAAVIGLAAGSYTDTARMHEMWLTVDTTMTAALLGALAIRLVDLARLRRSPRRRYSDHVYQTSEPCR